MEGNHGASTARPRVGRERRRARSFIRVDSFPFAVELNWSGSGQRIQGNDNKSACGIPATKEAAAIESVGGFIPRPPIPLPKVHDDCEIRHGAAPAAGKKSTAIRWGHPRSVDGLTATSSPVCRLPVRLKLASPHDLAFLFISLLPVAPAPTFRWPRPRGYFPCHFRSPPSPACALLWRY